MIVNYAPRLRAQPPTWLARLGVAERTVHPIPTGVGSCSFPNESISEGSGRGLVLLVAPTTLLLWRSQISLMGKDDYGPALLEQERRKAV